MAANANGDPTLSSRSLGRTFPCPYLGPRLCLVIALLLAGCAAVPRPKYEAAKDRAADLEQRLERSQAQVAQLTEVQQRSSEQVAAAQRQLAGRSEVVQILEERVDNLRRENDRLQGELTAVVMNNSGHNIVAAGFKTAAKPGADVPEELSRRLAGIARKYEGLKFDPLDHVLRMQTELMFSAGGDRLRPEARGTLRELAEAMKARGATRFNLSIVGHTWGEKQVTRELAAQHPTDWHLAAHQAIACEQYLEEHGVAPDRLGVMSYGSQQPLGEGDDDVAHRTNARIEIYLWTDEDLGIGQVPSSTRRQKGDLAGTRPERPGEPIVKTSATGGEEFTPPDPANKPRDARAGGAPKPTDQLEPPRPFGSTDNRPRERRNEP